MGNCIRQIYEQKFGQTKEQNKQKSRNFSGQNIGQTRRALTKV